MVTIGLGQQWLPIFNQDEWHPALLYESNRLHPMPPPFVKPPDCTFTDAELVPAHSLRWIFTQAQKALSNLMQIASRAAVVTPAEC